MNIENLLIIFCTLVGWGALVTFVINTGKRMGYVKDGDAPAWSGGLNLIGLVGVFVLQMFFPQLNITLLDTNLAALVNVARVMVGFVLEMGASRLTHNVIKGVPYVGSSHTLKRAQPTGQWVHRINTG